MIAAPPRSPASANRRSNAASPTPNPPGVIVMALPNMPKSDSSAANGTCSDGNNVHPSTVNIATAATLPSSEWSVAHASASR